VRRFLGPAAGLVAALVLGLLAAFLWRSATDDARAPEGFPSQLSVLTRIEPRVHGIGDRIVAEIVVLVDTTVIDPDSIRPLIDYEPYDRIEPVERTVEQSGAVARLTYRYPLLCDAEACTPSEETPFVQLPVGSVFYRTRSSPRPVAREIEWPQITFARRATDQEVETGSWRVDSPAILPVSYRFSPGALAVIFFGGSLAFLLIVAAIAWQFVDRRRRQAEPEEVVDTRPPLERALDAARHASLDGAVPDRRRALERVARELTARGEDELAARARTLAWSPDGASRQAVDDLAGNVRAATAPEADGEDVA
jgi:hypothetical protein